MDARKIIIIVVISILSITALVGLSYGLGWIGVHQTKTIGKAKENARREVWEDSEAYVQGKRAELLKYYNEYRKTEDPEEKEAIKQAVKLAFSNISYKKFDEPLKSWLYTILYE